MDTVGVWIVSFRKYHTEEWSIKVHIDTNVGLFALNLNVVYFGHICRRWQGPCYCSWWCTTKILQISFIVYDTFNIVISTILQIKKYVYEYGTWLTSYIFPFSNNVLQNKFGKNRMKRNGIESIIPWVNVAIYSHNS